MLQAILVASIRLHFLDLQLHHGYTGPQVIACRAELARGQEMGWFEHGSTIVVPAPPGLRLHAGIATGRGIKAGDPLFDHGCQPRAVGVVRAACAAGHQQV